MAGGDLRFGTTSMYMGVMYHKPAPSQRTKPNLHGYSVQIQLASTHCRTTDFMHFGGKIQGELQLSLLLHIDALALLFVTLSAGLWLLTTVYAIGYLKGDPEQRRFFGFFCLCVTSTVGIALAGNLLTFFIFYELLTLTKIGRAHV